MSRKIEFQAVQIDEITGEIVVLGTLWARDAVHARQKVHDLYQTWDNSLSPCDYEDWKCSGELIIRLDRKMVWKGEADRITVYGSVVGRGL